MQFWQQAQQVWLIMLMMALTIMLVRVVLCAAGQWRRACVCCEALMRGCNDRAALSSSEAYALSRGAEAPAAPGPAGNTLLASLGVTAPLATPGQVAAAAAASSSGAEPEAPVQKQQQQMWGIMGFGGLFIDNYQLPPDAADTQVRGETDYMALLPIYCIVYAYASQLI